MPRTRGGPSAGSSSRRRRRRDEEEEEEDFPSDDTSDSEFVADSEDEAAEEDEDGDEGFAPDEDAPAAAAAPAPAVAVGAPPPAWPQRRTGRKGKKARRGDGPPLPWETWEESNEKWLDKYMESFERGEQPEEEHAAVPTAEPAPEVVLPLLRFQKEWLAWALAQEASSTRGGILADEMGMGKTIQAISLVLTARRLRPPGQQAASSPALPRVGCTLVICPVVAVIQWAQEIERHTSEGSVRVLIYHGARRGLQKSNFDNFDFVITTYSTIEADYRKHIMPSKIRCEYCDKLFYPDKMKVHLRYYCGPDAVRTEKQAKQQSKKKDIGKVRGKRRGHKKEENDDYEEFGDELGSQSRDQSPLHIVRWERIILDEEFYRNFAGISQESVQFPQESRRIPAFQTGPKMWTLFF